MEFPDSTQYDTGDRQTVTYHGIAFQQTSEDIEPEGLNLTLITSLD